MGGGSVFLGVFFPACFVCVCRFSSFFWGGVGGGGRWCLGVGGGGTSNQPLCSYQNDIFFFTAVGRGGGGVGVGWGGGVGLQSPTP